jgi:hypothetical protein
MGIAYNTSVVRDGLVLHLDAANIKSYPGSDTTWFDVSNTNNNGTLVNGVSYNTNNKGYFNFDGISDHVTVQADTSLDTSNNTIICWAKSNTETWNKYGMLISRRNMYVMHPQLGTKEVRYYYYLNSAWQFESVTPPDITIWNMYACSWDGTAIRAYLNGEEIDIKNNTGPLSIASDVQVTIGRDGTSATRLFNGSISNILMYNRALTAAEIRQNFEALRGRYGI